MSVRSRRRAAKAREVQLCESCGEVCSASCRAQARLDRTRAEVAYLLPYPR